MIFSEDRLPPGSSLGPAFSGSCSWIVSQAGLTAHERNSGWRGGETEEFKTRVGSLDAEAIGNPPQQT